MLPDAEEWVDAHVRVADKWDGKMGIGAGVGTWKERARRAEADAAAARLLGHQTRVAREAQLRELERAIDEATHSISWRITTPLRVLTRRRRADPDRAGRIEPGDAAARRAHPRIARFVRVRRIDQWR